MKWDRFLDYTEQRDRLVRSVLPEVLSRQWPDGSWDLRVLGLVTPALALRVRLSLEDIERMNSARAPRDLYIRAWVTSIVVYWMQSRGVAFKPEWSPAAQKAKQWLSRKAPPPPYRSKWMECVGHYLKASGA